MRTSAVASLVLAVVTGCSGTRGGTSLHAITRDINGCAAALPVARKAVTVPAALVEIRSVTAKAAQRDLRAAGHAPIPREQLRGRLCVIAYRGPFESGALPLAGSHHGRYAVLLLRVRHPTVLAISLVDALPHER